MTKTRSYKLLCPIARALDRIGDRWTLLILRDLHAGPARFGELQTGLKGIAANLLTDRLSKLVGDGLVQKDATGHRTVVYVLTDQGRRTLDIIFELAVFGAEFAPVEPTGAPGNLRTVATTLSATARRVDTSDIQLRLGLDVDGTLIQLNVAGDDVQVMYGTHAQPDVILTTQYEDLLAVTECVIAADVFAKERSRLSVVTQGKDQVAFELMGRIVAVLSARA